MKKLLIVLLLAVPVFAQNWFPNPTQAQDYVAKRVSSYDRTGGNADARPIAPGETLTIFDEDGPGVITHIWFTIAAPIAHHLKKLVLRMYWDGEREPAWKPRSATSSAWGSATITLPIHSLAWSAR